MVDESADQRRKQAMKRKISVLEEKAKLLDQLLLILQETDEVCAAQVLNLIRSHASLEQIRMYVDDIVNRARIEMSPELLEALTQAKRLDDVPRKTSRPKSKDKSLHEMVLFRVPAKPWTTVTDDDDFVSHLMSLWFTWSHPYLNWIDRDLFIRDMQSGNPKAKFCSPFLVNVILADACGFSDYSEAYGAKDEQPSRGIHFYHEAKRLLDEQEGRTRQKAGDLCAKAARQNAALIQQQRESWGLDCMPPIDIHWFTVSMYTLLESLDNQASRDAFVSLSIAAKAASHRWALGRGMLRLVQLTSKQMEVTLPPETEALFSDFEAQLWRHQDRKALSSQYPNFVHSMNRGKGEEFELDVFLEKFDDLQVTPELETPVCRSVDGLEDTAWEGTELGSQ
ncbi:hypothetical protein N7457_004095 [Penicillium paradoxum]|uniref:uncharacterized protein n=1 Tax=Penicillium paradoxum TaxID=176176 RepID=UPI002547D555|nr:uncharacterized protein N7457_004095 [Penicillium paradoxum]KAJ5782321.1 hypothetical protein N7457_004095 [Penicillium paradoxum]